MDMNFENLLMLPQTLCAIHNFFIFIEVYIIERVLLLCIKTQTENIVEFSYVIQRSNRKTRFYLDKKAHI